MKFKKTLIISILITLVLIGTLTALRCFSLYDEENDKFFINSILTILGFLITILGIVLGFILGLENEEKKKDKRIEDITNGIEIIFPDFPPDRKKIVEFNLRVLNTSKWTIHNAGAYITINNKPEDLVNLNDIKFMFPKSFENIPKSVFLDRDKGAQIVQEKLSWAFKNGFKQNPHKVDINSSEIQDLLFFKFSVSGFIEVASELGFSSDNLLESCSRCFLEDNKDYEIIIKIVSDDTIGKEFYFHYHSETRDLISYEKPRKEK